MKLYSSCEYFLALDTHLKSPAYFYECIIFDISDEV